MAKFDNQLSESLKIKPKATLTNGNTVSNKAFIYFDYNAAIATNTAVTQIKNPLLPLRIMNYELRVMNEKKVLNFWTTANEINASHFVIQRSEDGRVFKSVGTIAAKGNGTYNFIDELKTKDQLPKTLYYRLQIVDKDGSYSFSEIKQIRLNELTGKQINILSNPARSELVFKVNNLSLLNTQATLVNSTGVAVKRFIISSTTQKIAISNLPTGVYYLHTNSETKKVIIE